LLRAEIGYLGAAGVLCTALWLLYRHPGRALRVERDDPTHAPAPSR
jgi:hypothetical protein